MVGEEGREKKQTREEGENGNKAWQRRGTGVEKRAGERKKERRNRIYHEQPMMNVTTISKWHQ